MKANVAAAIGGLVVFGLAGSAKAGPGHDPLILSPPSTSFQLQGSLTMTVDSQPQVCKITLTGMTSAGGDKFHAGSITGGSGMGACKKIQFLNLPYYIAVANGKGVGNIYGMTYKIGADTCAQVLNIVVKQSGAWSIVNANGCLTTGTAKSTPPITVIKAP